MAKTIQPPILDLRGVAVLTTCWNTMGGRCAGVGGGGARYPDTGDVGGG